MLQVQIIFIQPSAEEAALLPFWLSSLWACSVVTEHLLLTQNGRRTAQQPSTTTTTTTTTLTATLCCRQPLHVYKLPERRPLVLLGSRGSSVRLRSILSETRERDIINIFTVKWNILRCIIWCLAIRYVYWWLGNIRLLFAIHDCSQEDEVRPWSAGKKICTKTLKTNKESLQPSSNQWPQMCFKSQTQRNTPSLALK